VGATVFHDLDNDAYHWHKAISRSGVVEFMKSPANYWNAYHNDDRPKKESTQAMNFGTAFHTLMLEPHLFEKQFVVKPEQVFLKDTDRETFDNYKAYMAKLAKSKKIILSIDEMATLHHMKNSIEKHPQAMELISHAKYEHSIFWTDEDTGLELKTRPDAWHHNMTVDLKTIISADPRTFQSAMVSHGYHIQSAMMREGIRAATGDDILNHIFVCVEKTFPFLVSVYILDETALEAAHNTLRRVLSEIKFCYESNQWPGYETQTIGLPNWAMKNIED
jgi:exodeoxyribonuclease VIII